MRWIRVIGFGNLGVFEREITLLFGLFLHRHFSAMRALDAVSSLNLEQTLLDLVVVALTGCCPIAFRGGVSNVNSWYANEYGGESGIANHHQLGPREYT
jgi:hypothetical protein